jgi:riboflavin kinase/FMN adenylyltransferase
MKIFNGINSFNLKKDKPLVMAMGMFDGLHLGHKKVISEAKKLASKLNGYSFVLTFDTHPRKIINSDPNLGILTTNEEKISILKKIDIDGILFLYFDKTTSQMAPELFIKHYLIDKLNIKGLVVGEDFKFGKNKKGDLKLLKNLASKYNFALKAIKNIKKNSQKISSTLIKKELSNSKLKTANSSLDYNYFIENKVIKGHEIAKKFGTPTANLHIPFDKILPEGVFIGLTEYKNKKHPSIVSVGHKPTLNNENKLCIETHILDFNKDIYGKNIKVSFIKKIRNQKKFKSLDLLFNQVKKDIKQAEIFFKTQKDSLC